jgi:hypothetical protein
MESQDGDALTAEAMRSFLAQPGAGVWTGRMLYPRFYEIGKGETAADIPYNHQPYPRMAFTLIGPAGQMGVILPGELRAHFWSGADVLVLGCGSESGRIDALVVIPSTERMAFSYLREPMPELVCPLRAPVCVDHDTCR